jgi:hypothetical protein
LYQVWLFGSYRFSHFDRDKCLRREAGRQNYQLIGDSTPHSFGYGLSNLVDGVHILQATTAGCRPEFRQAKAHVMSCRDCVDEDGAISVQMGLY